MVTRVAFRTAMRDAAVQMLSDYANAADVNLQVYRARPRTLYPPTAFPDRINERVTFTGPELRSRVVSCEVVVIHALFDSGDAVDQGDRFIDGFTEWVLDHKEAADPNTTIGAVLLRDDPNYIPDWQPPAERRSYYATIVTLEGLALD
jgi:hypothetical protein